MQQPTPGKTDRLTQLGAEVQQQAQRVPGYDQALFKLGGTPVTVGSLVSFAVILLVAYLISFGLRRTLRRVYRGRGVDEGVAYALNRLLHYAVLAIGFMEALAVLGVSVTALAGFGAIFAVGIGFGLQNIAQNFVSGLVLLFERPVKQGDFVEVGSVRGTVRQIHARATVITTLDNTEILVPNAQLITEAVLNHTYTDRRVRMRVGVGVAYGSDTARVQDTLLGVARRHPQVLTTPSPDVLFTEFGESSLDFALLVWVSDPTLQPRIASDLRFAVDAAFRAAEIEIPFPQRDINFRSADRAG